MLFAHVQNARTARACVSLRENHHNLEGWVT